MKDTITGEVTDLIQALIRNRCVNDGTAESGHEFRSVATLRSYLGTSGFDSQTFESAPGRESLVVRIDGTDPSAPTLLLMGHTDVVPVTAESWQRDPFGGELVDGFVWGRGAIDMLNLTASMAVAMRRLARSNFRPRGTLIYLAVADEESGGDYGAEWLVENHLDAVRADYVITESGGMQVDSPGGRRILLTVGEKGVSFVRLTLRGTPGHASRPYKTDNALIKAAEVVRRLADHPPMAQIGTEWRHFVESMTFPHDVVTALTDPGRVADGLVALEPALAARAHACTRMTVTPTVVRGGVKFNVIPDRVELEVDVRTLPHQDQDYVVAYLADALGDLWPELEYSFVRHVESTVSPVDTPLWDTLVRGTARAEPDAVCVPTMTAGSSDARPFRAAGAVAYGFGAFSRRIDIGEWSRMFHGNDERVDQESLRLSTELWEWVARDLVG